MMDFKELYKAQADKSEISNELLIKTKHKMSEAKKPSRHFRFTMRTVVVTATLVACMGITTFAYEYHQNQQYYKLTNRNIEGNHEYIGPQEDVQVVDETVEAANITATMTNVKADYNNIYLTVVLKTTNGSELNINTENCIPRLEGQKFENSYFVVDGTNVNFSRVTRTDNASDPTTATFELWYSDTQSYTHSFNDPASSNVSLKSMEGKDIQVVLENYNYMVKISKSLNFKFLDVQTMLASAPLAQESEYSSVGVFITYADGTQILSNTLAAGTQKIYFSDKYPATYIDNVGIHEYGEMNYQRLYLSIVTESEEAKADLLAHLTLLNKENGNFVGASQPHIGGGGAIVKNADGTTTMITDAKNVQPDGNRIVLIFDAGIDSFTNGVLSSHLNTTMDLLNKYTLILNGGTETKTIKGKWDIDFKLEKMKAMLTYQPNQTIQKNGKDLVINSIELSDSNIAINGTMPPNFELKSLGRFYLILSDGTRVDVGNKIGGGGNTLYGGPLILSGNLQTLVDSNDVVAVEIFGNIVQLK